MKLADNIHSVAEWLTSKGYLYKTKQGGFLLTASFHKDLKESAKNSTFIPPETEGKSTEIAVIEPTFPLPEKYQQYNYTDWVKFYQDFIVFCKIPNKLESSNNNTYSANKYSEDGMKAFQKALKEGYRYDILMAAISLYYKSGIRWKKAIGTYMSSGEWRSDYAQLLEKAEEGTKQLHDHIKNTIDDSRGTHFEFG